MKDLTGGIHPGFRTAKKAGKERVDQSPEELSGVGTDANYKSPRIIPNQPVCVSNA